MKLLFKYLSTCWFISNPAELTPPMSFMWKNVTFYLVSGCIVEGLIADPADGTLEVLGRTIMAFTTIATLLLFEKKWHYFNQLYTSIFVCENFIMTLAVGVEALYFWMVINHKPHYEEIATGLGIMLAIWYVTIVAYIFRRFFNHPTNVSLIFAFSYFVMTYGIPMMLMDI
ncbi:MAG: hypothetical protein ACU836_05755 [Gammaproteobacteria bacterium]